MYSTALAGAAILPKPEMRKIALIRILPPSDATALENAQPDKSRNAPFVEAVAVSLLMIACPEFVSAEFDQVECRKDATGKLLQPATRGQRSEINRGEPHFLENGAHVRLRGTIVPRQEHHAASTGLSWVGRQDCDRQCVGGLHYSRAWRERSHNLARCAATEI